MLKLERMHRQTGETFVDPTNVDDNKRVIRLLDLTIFNNLVQINTLGPDKPSRR